MTNKKSPLFGLWITSSSKGWKTSKKNELPCNLFFILETYTVKANIISTYKTELLVLFFHQKVVWHKEPNTSACLCPPISPASTACLEQFLAKFTHPFHSISTSEVAQGKVKQTNQKLSNHTFLKFYCRTQLTYNAERLPSSQYTSAY